MNPRKSDRQKQAQPRSLPPEVLTDDEVRALLAACREGARPATAARNAALVALLYRSGLRIAEALALRPKDLDLEAGTVRVLAAKGFRGSRWRVSGIDPGAAAYLAAWLNVRGTLPACADPATLVFCTESGAPLSTAYIRVLLPRLARRAGIAKRVHAHGLRHTHAAQLREEGVDVGIISRQLGHRSLLTTIRYLDHIAPTAVVRAMRGRRWEQARRLHMPFEPRQHSRRSRRYSAGE